MKRVLRLDYGQVSSSERTPQGYLKCQAIATRVGVFNYRMPDGSLLRELRLPEEVFSEDSLKTLAGIPVTNDHPDCGLIDATNTKDYAVGFTSDNVSHDDNFVMAGVTVTDADAIDDIVDLRKREVSCGYKCMLDFTPGSWNGDDYDCIQRNIEYNHVAIVDRGRAGPSVRLKLDSAGDEIGVQVQPEKENQMEKITLGGQEFQVAPELKTAIETVMNDSEKSVQTAQAKADAAESELNKTRVQLDAAEKIDVKGLVKARLNIEKVAAAVLPAGTNVDSMDDIEVMKAVIKANSPEANLDGKKDAYVEARFDCVKESLSANVQATKALAETIVKAETTVQTDSEDKVELARKRQREEALNGYKAPLTSSAQ